MFSKAPVKRFNDRVNDTPAPDAYDVKELGPKGDHAFLSIIIWIVILLV